MRLFRQGFTLKHKTFTGLITDMLLWFVIITILSTVVFSALLGDAGRTETVNLGLVALSGIVLGLAGFVPTALQLRRHKRDLTDFCTRHNYTYGLYAGEQESFENSSLLELGQRDRRLSNYIQAPDWEYSEFSYVVYRRTKHGEYPYETVYYGVMSIQLPRILPHVFFDSKHARGRQFRWVFTHDQKHSLEGDFDQYFTTYFPPDYTIDGLSFITPEVMWALRAAGDYDIEIIGDRLYLYAPIYDDENRIQDMADKLLTIKEKLLHNILTYRDQRLPGLEGKTMVAPMGMHLKKSQFLKRLAAVFTVLWLIFYLWVNWQK
jgi:hypothetical protein